MPRKALGGVRADSSDAGKHRMDDSLRIKIKERMPNKWAAAQAPELIDAMAPPRVERRSQQSSHRHGS